MKRVIIVGSGLAGLTAGYRLHQRGWQVTVLESLGRVGGRVLSESEDGFLFDVGPAIVTDAYTEYMKLIDDVGLSHDVVDCAPVMAVVRGNDLHLLDARKPLRSFAKTELLTTRAKLRLVANGLRLIKPLSRMNPSDVRNRLQYDDQCVETYLNRVFGQDLNEQLLEGMTRTMTTNSPRTASSIGFFAGAVHASGTMQTLMGGLQRLPVELAAVLDVKLNSPVTSVRRTERGVTVEYRDESGALIDEQSDACVIATRFAVAADIYPVLKDVGARLLEATASSGCYTAQLTYGRRTDKEPFLVMVPTAASQEVGTLFLEHLKAPDRAPAGTSLISAFLPLGGRVDISTWSDERLKTVTRELIERLFPELRGHFRTARLTRWPYAAHTGDVGYYRALQQFLDAYPDDDPVQLAGDYLATSGQETAVVTGVAAAKRIMADGSASDPLRKPVP
jgi:protoporphyrinogen oxidase